MTGTGTFTIPTGHTYCWILVGCHGYSPNTTGSAFTVAFDDVTFSGAASASPPTLVSSTDRAYTTSAGTHSLKVTWNGTGQAISRSVTLSAGVAHTTSAWCYVPSGSPAVTIKSKRTTSTGTVITTTGETTSFTGTSGAGSG